MVDSPRATIQPNICVLCGGVGAARFLRGLVEVVPQSNITAIVNTADDLRLHGLAISPDLDTCTYTLADIINPETGWGLAGETWQARETLAHYGGQTWFGLGDRDLGTHLYRTQRLDEGATLAEVTAEISSSWGLDLTIKPMSNDPVRTRVTLLDGQTIDFQRYFVERQHRDHVVEVQFTGTDQAKPAPDVLERIASADRIVIAPSNPFVSVAPILAVNGIREVVESRREITVAVSPIVGGDAVKGPAADLMKTLGHEVSVVGIAKLYADLGAHLVIDDADSELSEAVAAAGMIPHVTDTIMQSVSVAAKLAAFTIDAITPGAIPPVDQPAG